MSLVVSASVSRGAVLYAGEELVMNVRVEYPFPERTVQERSPHRRANTQPGGRPPRMPSAGAEEGQEGQEPSLDSPFSFIKSAMALPSFGRMFTDSSIVSSDEGGHDGIGMDRTPGSNNDSENEFVAGHTPLEDNINSIGSSQSLPDIEEPSGRPAGREENVHQNGIRINYSYVQLFGTMTYDDDIIKSALLDPLKERASYKGAGIMRSDNKQGVLKEANITNGTLNTYTVSATTKLNGPTNKANANNDDFNDSVYHEGGHNKNELNMQVQNENQRFREYPVFSTPPSILLCDAVMKPGNVREFSYRIKLPNELVPSYKGKAVRFEYRAEIGIQRGLFTTTPTFVKFPFKILGVPGRIYPVEEPIVQRRDEALIVEKILYQDGAPLIKYEEEANINDEDDEDSSAFYVRAAWEGSRSVNVKIDSGDSRPIAELQLERSVWRAGESIRGQIISVDNACERVCVWLECSEDVSKDYVVQNFNNGKISLDNMYHTAHRRICSVQKDIGASLRVPLVLTVPSGAAPSIKSSVVNVSWQLRVCVILRSSPESSSAFRRRSSVAKSGLYPMVDVSSAISSEGNNDRVFVAEVSTSADAYECVVPITVVSPRAQHTGPITAISKV